MWARRARWARTWYQRLHGCVFFHHPAKGKGEPQGATIYIQGWAEDFSLADCDFGTSNVKAAVWIDSTRNPVKQVHLTNNRFENKNQVLLLATGRTFLVDFEGNTCYGTGTNYIRADHAEYWRIQGNMFGRSDTPTAPAAAIPVAGAKRLGPELVLVEG